MSSLLDSTWSSKATALPIVPAVACMIAALLLFAVGPIFGVINWLSLAVVVVLVGAACYGRGGFLAWLNLLWGVWVFEGLRALAPRLGMPVHGSDVWHLEQMLWFGRIPTQLLQQLLFDPAQPGAFDYAASAVHLSYLVVPYLAMLVVWAADPLGISRLSYQLLLTFGVSLVVLAVLPAMPPWLASVQSDGHSGVYRVLAFVTGSVSADTYSRVGEAIGDPNPVAALPSVHFAVTFALYLYSRSGRPAFRVVGLLYSLAMAFSLVYLGEHYVIDILAGGAVAWICWHGQARVPWRSAIQARKGLARR